jgi:ADP-ribose pyrophosphatase YjhB (NUDIX family)
MEQDETAQIFDRILAREVRMKAYHEEMMAIMDAHYEKMRAISKKYLGTTEAEKEPAPEDTEAVEELH